MTSSFYLHNKERSTMTDNKKYPDEQEPVNRSREFSERSSRSTTLRSIHPLGMRVVVQIPASSERSDGGLYLPESAKSRIDTESILVEVLEVASAIDDDTHEETNISGIPKGAKILIPREAGIRVPWNESLRIVESKDVLALVEELSIS